jgi:hypothetical protein
MTQAQALRQYSNVRTEDRQPRAGDELRLWYEIQEAVDYVKSGKAHTLAGAGWTVNLRSEHQVTIVIALPGGGF